jgi:hypothetical protein
MRRFSMVLSAALITIGASSAAAQTQGPAGVPPAPGRFTVFVNGGFQISGQDINRTTTFDLYEEQARLDIVQDDIGGGGFFEVGGSWRFLDRIGAGLSYSFLGSSGDSTVEGSLPHPLVFDQFRTLSASADGLDHKERVVHLFATWHMPVTEKIDVTFSAGPSFFNISQELIRSVSFSETPPFSSVTVDAVEIASLKQNGVGFNLGADAIYGVTQFMGYDLGVGATARYTRGSADFDVTDGQSVSVKAGGFQMGFGVRVRF